MVASNATLLAPNPTSFTILIPKATLKTHLNISKTTSYTQQFSKNSFFLTFSRTHFNSHSNSLKKFNLFHPQAQKKPRENHSVVIEDEDSDYMDDEDEFDEFDDDVDEEDEESEGMLVPLEKMKQWLENKPRGFGEGKVYDTSIEDTLLQEIEQSKQAQEVNINNLKNNPVVVSAPKKQTQIKKVIEDVVPGGVRVRVVNLPKKKNVHRDLNAAFKGVSGIVNVVPAVTGSKKTTDPICKGFAFVDFKSMKDAAGFVQQFSRQRIQFGRVEKQIRCEILNSGSSSNSSDDDGSVGGFHSTQQLMDPTSEGESDYEFVDDFSSEETATDMFSDKDSEFIEADFEDITENVESFSISDFNGPERTMSVSGSFSSKKPKKNSKKKVAVKGNAVKVPKLDVPGSAKRLKIKEKSMLTDVFTKYGSASTLVSSEGR